MTSTIDTGASSGNPLAAAREAHRAGRVAEAEAGYLDVVQRLPSAAAAAYQGLGILFAQTQRGVRAIEAFHAALRLDPGNAATQNDLGSALAQAGRLDEAIVAFRGALALRPDAAKIHANLGAALSQRRQLPEAIACFARAIELAPTDAEPHRSLALAKLQQGDIDYAFASFTRHAQLKYRAQRRPTRPSPPAKARHDREQLDYLITALDHPAAKRVREAIRANPSAPILFDALFEQLFHLDGGDALAGAAVNPAIAATEVERRWTESKPNLVVVDDLLTPQALEGIRRFCWGSTIWRATYPAGYLGAMPEDGFACPLLAQIATELRSRLPGIFAHELLQTWAFKYDSRLKGIGMHADFAAVNVNFWITADAANRNPKGGGLLIWDVPAPLDWDYDQYNNYNGDASVIRDFLARAGARVTRVPHRANRAVIFDSDLFHQTDDIAFVEGYLNRRINITLLYGMRENRAQR